MDLGPITIKAVAWSAPRRPCGVRMLEMDALTDAIKAEAGRLGFDLVGDRKSVV